jgi:hypothetical protein
MKRFGRVKRSYSSFSLKREFVFISALNTVIAIIREFITQLPKIQFPRIKIPKIKRPEFSPVYLFFVPAAIAVVSACLLNRYIVYGYIMNPHKTEKSVVSDITTDIKEDKKEFVFNVDSINVYQGIGNLYFEVYSNEYMYKGSYYEHIPYQQSEAVDIVIAYHKDGYCRYEFSLNEQKAVFVHVSNYMSNLTTL